MKQIILVIFDGWGYRKEKEGNAIEAANKPCFDALWKNSPHSLLEASGKYVGLPDGEMGNSEVGHLAIGAGTVIKSDVVRISEAFATGEAEHNPAFVELFRHVKSNNSTLHIMGLLSPGGIHSHEEHIYGFLRLAKKAGIKKIAIHAFMDGRDTPPDSGVEYVANLEDVLKDLGVGEIATLSGRYFAMDRDNNWDRVQKVEKALFHGEGDTHHENPEDALREMYAKQVSDEHMPVYCFKSHNEHSSVIKHNDGVLFANFRADRARMLSKKISDRMHEMNLHFVTMTQYDKKFEGSVAFPPVTVKATLADEISNAGLTQAHIAETEKYAHVTYFLNGGVEARHPKEEFILIESHKDVPTHDRAPEMRAMEITDKAITQVEKGTNFVVLNYANADMVGHSANFDATVLAIEAIDKNLTRLVDVARKHNAVMVITADHGNAEMSQTYHTSSPVPVIIDGIGSAKLRVGSLIDIAPTILTLFSLPIPPSMTGTSLIV